MYFKSIKSIMLIVILVAISFVTLYADCEMMAMIAKKM